MMPRLPTDKVNDATTDRAQAEARFAEKLFKILLTLQSESAPDPEDIPRAGELNRKHMALYNEIWDAAFHVLTTKKKKKIEVSNA